MTGTTEIAMPSDAPIPISGVMVPADAGATSIVLGTLPTSRATGPWELLEALAPSHR